MMRKLILLIPIIFAAAGVVAQQFIGYSAMNYANICLMPSNPSYVNDASTGMEINVFSASAMAGTNAFKFSRGWFSGGLNAGAAEGIDYIKDNRQHLKYLWGNIDVLGPAAAFAFKNGQHFGIYTRMRQIERGGHINSDAASMLGDISGLQFPDTVSFERAGFTVHAFGELGFTYGKILLDDYYHILKAGITVKYLAGMAAGTLYASSISLIKNRADSINVLKGDVTALYSKHSAAYVDNDPNNDITAWFNRGARGSLGLDLGIQYEYHPNGDPNGKTPYAYKIAASLTDLGSMSYKADSGSGDYTLNIKNIGTWQFSRFEFENFASYLGRLKKDTLIRQTDSPSRFRMGLPTAFRLNGDLGIGTNVWLQVNILLNLKGNHDNRYRPGYVSMFNITPRFEKGWFMLGLPFSYWGYQTMSAGVVMRAGPLFLGSVSVISSLVSKQITNVDGYAGLVLKLKDNKRDQY